jgi:hypothetical protein
LVDELWAGKGEICKIRGPEARARLRPEIFLAEPHSGPEHSGQLADPPHSVFNLFRNYANFFSLKKKIYFEKNLWGRGNGFGQKCRQTDGIFSKKFPVDAGGRVAGRKGVQV